MAWIGKSLVAALLVSGVMALSIYSVCDLIYDCGCEPVWESGVEHCNIYTPGVPHCPWCIGGSWRLVWVKALMLLPALFLIVFTAHRDGSWWFVSLAGVFGYALGALIAGLLGALLTGYPVWLGLRIG